MRLIISEDICYMTAAATNDVVFLHYSQPTLHLAEYCLCRKSPQNYSPAALLFLDRTWLWIHIYVSMHPQQLFSVDQKHQQYFSLNQIGEPTDQLIFPFSAISIATNIIIMSEAKGRWQFQILQQQSANGTKSDWWTHTTDEGTKRW